MVNGPFAIFNGYGQMNEYGAGLERNHRAIFEGYGTRGSELGTQDNDPESVERSCWVEEPSPCSRLNMKTNSQCPATNCNHPGSLYRNVCESYRRGALRKAPQRLAPRATNLGKKDLPELETICICHASKSLSHRLKRITLATGSCTNNHARIAKSNWQWH